MDLSLTLGLLPIVSGSAVGLVLGLVGGGGSVLAVPLLLYVVGMPDTHMAIGTSAVAVAASAFANLITHARRGTVKWRIAAVFAACGMVGAWLGSSLGIQTHGPLLLRLFAGIMIVVGIFMWLPRKSDGDPSVRLHARMVPPLAGTGLGVGMVSGFFGIGGGFLIVPGLRFSSGMAMLNAVGSSLVGVTAFGLTTAANYTRAQLVDWPVALLFVLGGFLGGLVGVRVAQHLATIKGALSRALSVIIILTAVVMLVQGR